jgi:hypothetical protein
MSLSQHERMILKEIEDEFTQRDPQLSARLAGITQIQPHQPRRVVLAVLLALALGITLVILGKVAAAPLATRLGLAAAILAATCWMHILVMGLLRRRRTS